MINIEKDTEMKRLFAVIILIITVCPMLLSDNDEKSNATVYAICDDSFEMYINEVQALAMSKEIVAKAEITLNKGDRITVRCMDFGKGYGFSCVIVFKDKSVKPVSSGFKDWKYYKPKNKDEWYKLNGITGKQAAKPGTNKAWKNLVVAKTGIQCESIWGDPKETLAYLFYEAK